ncbi:hypothetical protein [Pedococcus sp. 5OH_020]|uniref:hypothetical protein n=1 Tax=Pedococcus sp. 5OH_020 TaxID=2989814 RepID=UPI0022E9A3B7|nr:hypothetical protein [Pedococcus sp. 5OH_020]
MSTLAKRAALVVVGVVGLALVAVGVWFTAHLGVSGSASFTATPAKGAVVVLEPSLLNRVDRPVRVSAVAREGGVWMGRAAPSDVRAIVGNAARTTMTTARVGDWSLRQSRAGAGPAGSPDNADVWRQTSAGSRRVSLLLRQADAPEAVLIAAPAGGAPDLRSVTVTIERRTWAFQALLVTLVGLIVLSATLGALWYDRRGGAQSREVGEQAAAAEDETGPAGAPASARRSTRGASA